MGFKILYAFIKIYFYQIFQQTCCKHDCVYDEISLRESKISNHFIVM